MALLTSPACSETLMHPMTPAKDWVRDSETSTFNSSISTVQSDRTASSPIEDTEDTEGVNVTSLIDLNIDCPQTKSDVIKGISLHAFP